MTLVNVQSLSHEVDELQENVCSLKDFKDCCVMAFTQTWLTEHDEDEGPSVSGFATASFGMRHGGNRSNSRGVSLHQPEILH